MIKAALLGTSAKVSNQAGIPWRTSLFGILLYHVYKNLALFFSPSFEVESSKLAWVLCGLI